MFLTRRCCLLGEHLRTPSVCLPPLQVLRAHFPSHAILGEEGGVSGDTSSGLLWCVDPLDGTTNFSHQYPAFAGGARGVCIWWRVTGHCSDGAAVTAEACRARPDAASTLD